MRTDLTLRIGKYHSSTGKDGFTVELEDNKSRSRVFSTQISFRKFAELVSGAVVKLPDVEWFGKLVGCKREVKTEVIVVEGRAPMLDAEFKAWARAKLAPFETDGWIGYAEDLRNYHRIKEYNVGGDTKKCAYNVSFTRYLDKQGNPVVDW